MTEATHELLRGGLVAAPVALGQKLIRDCVEDWRSSQKYCEIYYSDYGAAQAIIGPDGETVGVRPALYMDLPACIAAWEAKMSGN